MSDFDAAPSKKLSMAIIRFIGTYEEVPHDQIMVALCILITTFASMHKISYEDFKLILDIMLDDFKKQLDKGKK